MKAEVSDVILFVIFAQALDILVRQMNYNSPDVIPVILDQLTRSAVWKFRVDAAKLLVHLGKLVNYLAHVMYACLGNYYNAIDSHACGLVGLG